jgi:hypothetical protein
MMSSKLVYTFFSLYLLSRERKFEARLDRLTAAGVFGQDRQPW